MTEYVYPPFLGFSSHQTGEKKRTFDLKWCVKLDVNTSSQIHLFPTQS